MARGCRDCPRCTEAVMFSLFFFPLRAIWSVLTSWNIGLVRRKCPQCRHLLAIHQKHQGKFVD